MKVAAVGGDAVAAIAAPVNDLVNVLTVLQAFRNESGDRAKRALGSSERALSKTSQLLSSAAEKLSRDLDSLQDDHPLILAGVSKEDIAAARAIAKEAEQCVEQKRKMHTTKAGAGLEALVKSVDDAVKTIPDPIAQKKTYRMLSEYEYALGTALEFDLAPHQVSQFHSILEHLTLEGPKNYDFGKGVSEVKLQAHKSCRKGKRPGPRR